MHPRILALLAVCLALPAFADDAVRPGPIAVRESVERSRAEYKALHPTVTKKQAAHKVDEEVQQARARLGQAYKLRNPKQRAAALKAANDEIAALVGEANAIVKDYKQADRNRLMPLKLNGIGVGDVGRLTEKNKSVEGLSYDHRFIRCLKVLGKNELLAVLEYREPAATDGSGGEPQLVQSPQFILKGIPVSASSEQQLLTGVYDVVVSAQQEYAEPDGEPRNLLVLEVFNPDQPFR